MLTENCSAYVPVAMFEFCPIFEEIQKPLIQEESPRTRTVTLKMIHRRHKLEPHLESALSNKEKCIIYW